MIQMTSRLKTAGLLLLILAVGMSVIVAITEDGAGADASSPSLLTVSDVVSAMEAQGLEIESERRPAQHPLLGVTGTTILVGTSSLEVYVYSDVSSRVAEEQMIQRQIMTLQSLAVDGNQVERVTSARNILLLFHTESSVHLMSIHAAARTLATAATS